MADGVEVKIEGLDELTRRFQALQLGIRRKAGRSALGKAARVVTNAAKQNVQRSDDPETGRRIADNITQRFRSRYFKRTGDLMVSVGVATPNGKIPKGNPDEGRKGPTPHWHLVEEGTEQARAQPFLRPAAAQNVAKVVQVFGSALEQQLDKLAQSK